LCLSLSAAAQRSRVAAAAITRAAASAARSRWTRTWRFRAASSRSRPPPLPSRRSAHRPQLRGGLAQDGAQRSTSAVSAPSRSRLNTPTRRGHQLDAAASAPRLRWSWRLTVALAPLRPSAQLRGGLAQVGARLGTSDALSVGSRSRFYISLHAGPGNPRIAAAIISLTLQLRPRGWAGVPGCTGTTPVNTSAVVPAPLRRFRQLRGGLAQDGAQLGAVGSSPGSGWGVIRSESVNARRPGGSNGLRILLPNWPQMSGRSSRPHYASDGSRHLLPPGAFDREPFAPGGSEAVVAGTTVGGRRFPLCGKQAAPLQAVKRGVERAMVLDFSRVFIMMKFLRSPIA
jgi:hypothetical protein